MEMLKLKKSGRAYTSEAVVIGEEVPIKNKLDVCMLCLIFYF